MVIGTDRVAQMVQDCEDGMSQSAVAQKYGVSQSSVSKYVLISRTQGCSAERAMVMRQNAP